jgi:hypothetical protein
MQALCHRQGRETGGPERPPVSVLERVKRPVSRHCHGKQPRRVQNADSARMLGQHLRQPAIRHRALVEIAAGQHDAALPQSRIHLETRAAARMIVPNEINCRCGIQCLQRIECDAP